MVKISATAAEIEAELRRRIELCPDRDGSCCGSGVPTPRFARPREEGGPNWTVDGLPELAPGCFGTILKIVDQVRLEYELAASSPSSDLHDQ